MKNIDFILQGFGFENLQDFKISTFGFILSSKIVKATGVLAFIATLTQELFGLHWKFMIAYGGLIIFEWGSGVLASLNAGEEHRSRYLGRMFLKILVYAVLVILLNQFRAHTDFPIIAGYEANPFEWLYWTVLIGIIWQLLVSVLENLEKLKFKWAGVILKIINRNFYKKFGIDEKDV